MHAVRERLLERQAAALGLALVKVEIPYPCANADYEAAMGAAVAHARAQGVAHMAFGDLFLEDVRRYREEKLAGTGLEPVFPLWGADTAELARAMIDGGLRARLTCIDPKVLPRELAGQAFDRALLERLPGGVDPCGENGEFHTFVTDGPGFAAPLDVVAGEIVERDGFVFADLVPAGDAADTDRAEASLGPGPARER
jgi:diphthamide synthase (EF-2-diphthine--ammonia ligase)